MVKTVRPRPASPTWRRRSFLWLIVLALEISLSAARAQDRYVYSSPHMGTEFRLVFWADDSLRASQAAAAAFERIEALNQSMSDYLADSELNRLSDTAGSGRFMHVSEDLWKVLVEARRISAETDGAFDVTVGALTRLWRRAIRRNELPDPASIDAASRTVGYQTIDFDSTRRSVRLTRPGTRLDLGGIAKGYAVDEAFEVLAGYGIKQALADGGGDLRVGDSPPGTPGWTIALHTIDSRDSLAVEHAYLESLSLATSGDTYRFVERDGIRYSHVLDPKSGMGITERRLVSVRAPTCMEADALASAFSVMGAARSLEYARKRRDVAVRFITGDGTHRVLTESEDFLAVLNRSEVP